MWSRESKELIRSLPLTHKLTMSDDKRSQRNNADCVTTTRSWRHNLLRKMYWIHHRNRGKLCAWSLSHDVLEVSFDAMKRFAAHCPKNSLTMSLLAIIIPTTLLLLAKTTAAQGMCYILYYFSTLLIIFSNNAKWVIILKKWCLWSIIIAVLYLKAHIIILLSS